MRNHVTQQSLERTRDERRNPKVEFFVTIGNYCCYWGNWGLRLLTIDAELYLTGLATERRSLKKTVRIVQKCSERLLNILPKSLKSICEGVYFHRAILLKMYSVAGIFQEFSRLFKNTYLMEHG